VSAVYLFGEYIAWVIFPLNANHIKSFVLYPFMDKIFLELNVVSCFRSHIVQPLHKSVVVVVQNSGRGDSLKGRPFSDTLRKRFQKSTTFFD
jgi:hypothetical protein